jgi:hypothetical protein
MAFNSDDFLPLSGMANSNAPRMWTYSAAADTITGANYFDGSFVSGVTQTGDILLGTDTGDTRLYILTVDRGAETVVLSTGTVIA